MPAPPAPRRSCRSRSTVPATNGGTVNISDGRRLPAPFRMRRAPGRPPRTARPPGRAARPAEREQRETEARNREPGSGNQRPGRRPRGAGRGLSTERPPGRVRHHISASPRRPGTGRTVPAATSATRARPSAPPRGARSRRRSRSAPFSATATCGPGYPGPGAARPPACPASPCMSSEPPRSGALPRSGHRGLDVGGRVDRPLTRISRRRREAHADLDPGLRRRRALRPGARRSGTPKLDRGERARIASHGQSGVGPEAGPAARRGGPRSAREPAPRRLRERIRRTRACRRGCRGCRSRSTRTARGPARDQLAA